MRIITPVTTHDDFYAGSDFAVLEIDETLMKRIKTLQKLVIENGLSSAVTHDDPITMHNMHPDEETDETGRVVMVDPEGNEGRTECIQMWVQRDKFFFSGLWKHTSVRWETHGIWFSMFEYENFNMPKILDLREEWNKSESGRSISDNDLCSDCGNLEYAPGEESFCKIGWPCLLDDGDEAVSCHRFRQCKQDSNWVTSGRED